MSIRYRFYAIGWSGISICSFAAAKILLFFEICKFLGKNLLNNFVLIEIPTYNCRKETKKARRLLSACNAKKNLGRADVLAFGKEIATVDTALLNRQSNSCLRSPQGLQILGDPIILNRRNGRRMSGVCQTSATAKKKKPDGFQNWLHVHNACWRIGQHDPVAMLGQGEQT
jgi:hypothetical protein